MQKSKSNAGLFSVFLEFCLKNSQPPEPFADPRADLNLKDERLNRYFFSTGTLGQPEVDSVNSRAEKHQMTASYPVGWTDFLI